MVGRAVADLAIPSRFHRLEEARAVFGDDVVDLLMRSATESDEPADAVIAAFRRLGAGTGWRMLDDALAADAGPRVPAELEALLRPVLDPPGWVDHDRLDAGATAWWRVGGFTQLLALSAGSLAYGYGVGSLARPLARTGRLTQMAPRRLGETARWALVATRPGALRPGGAGIRATVRLRLVHALVRAHLRAAGDWDTFNWGEPLSVGDTIATGVVGFFVYPLRGLEDIGVRFSADELEAMTHLWSYISFLMGGREEYLPRSFADALMWADAAMAIDSGAIAESRDLLRALLFNGLAFDRVMPRPAAAAASFVAGHALGAVARRWMGDERADELAAPDNPLKHLVPVLRPVVRAGGALRALGLLGSDARIVARELALTERTMALTGTVKHQLEPEAVERQPILRSAA
jgi:hypothetical protein